MLAAGGSFRWELQSPLLGPLLRRYAPHDTYHIYKKGPKVRIDGTLIGVDTSSGSLLPKWRRGRFSIIFDGQSQPQRVLFLQHEQQRVVPVVEQQLKEHFDIEEDIENFLAYRPNRAHVKTGDLKFRPVRRFWGGNYSELVEGWNCRLYEASGVMTAVTILKAQHELPAGLGFQGYLSSTLPEDTRLEMPLDPFSSDMGFRTSQPAAAAATTAAPAGEDWVESPVRVRSLSNSPRGRDTPPVSPTRQSSGLDASASPRGGKGPGNGGAATPPNRPRKPRRITAKCWMADDFPLSTRQLLPILDLLSPANKTIGRVVRFLQENDDQQLLFPVKVQVPLMFTVSAQVTFSDIKIEEPGGAPLRVGLCACGASDGCWPRGTSLRTPRRDPRPLLCSLCRRTLGSRCPRATRRSSSTLPR